MEEGHRTAPAAGKAPRPRPAPPATAGSDTEAFSAVVGQFYDATLDPSLWPAAVEAAGRYVEGCAASLASYDSTNHKGNFELTWNYDAECVRIYKERLIHRNPLVGASLRSQVGDFIEMPRDWPREVRGTEVEEVMLARQGWSEVAQITVERSATGYAFLIVARGVGQAPVDEAMRRRMALLLPHARRAVLIGRLLERRHVAAAALADTLDGIEAGLFLLDAAGRIVHANLAAQGMLGFGQAVRRSGDALALTDPGASRALRATLAACAGADDAALGSHGVAIPIFGADGAADGHHVAHVLPLNAGARRGAGAAHAAAVAAVFVRRATVRHASALEAVAKLHRLTPAEARVLLGIVEVGGVPQVAEAFGVSEATVRTHLKRVFDKTGTGRQADLVRVVAGMASPLRR